MSTQCATNMC